MRDALGGLVNLVIIVVFIVLVSGYLAFNVNYTKAFRVKNKIITAIESHENLDDAAKAEISNYAKSIGYNISTLNVDFPGNPSSKECYHGYCVAKFNQGDRKNYYEVVTFVTVDIPIIKKIMPHIEFFQVKGITKSITNKRGNG